MLDDVAKAHVLHVELNWRAKRNAFNIDVLEELGRAYERLERDDDLRVEVLYAKGDNFTGLDLAEVGRRLIGGPLDWPADARNPCAKTVGRGPSPSSPPLTASD